MSILQAPQAPPIPMPPPVPLGPPQGPQPYFGMNAYLPPMKQAAPLGSVPAADSSRRSGFKFKVAFYAAVMFTALSHPAAYRVMNQIVAAVTGAPYEIVTEFGIVTMKGLFLHTVAFFFLMLILLFKK